jgi:hypothetical protein
MLCDRIIHVVIASAALSLPCCEAKEGANATDAASSSGATSTDTSGADGSSTTGFESCGSDGGSSTTGEPLPDASTGESPECGDGVCETLRGEHSLNCKADCTGLPPGLSGCVTPWYGGSSVVGGPVDGVTALFSYDEYDPSLDTRLNLVLVFLGPGVLPEESRKDMLTGKGFMLYPDWAWEDGWLRSEIIGGSRLTVTEMVGSWEEDDPCDPPRLRGMFERIAPYEGFDGPFEAAYCEPWGEFEFH